MFFTTLWCNTSEEAFKRSVPLDALGKSLLKSRSTYEFNLVFLEGLELLSKNYLDRLKGYGFKVIDYGKQFGGIIKRFADINNFYGTYERNCYLRWIALHQLIKSETNPPTQFWHLDSDIILHTSLDELALDTKGKTFMLQGCPVFVSISDMNWFNIYESELEKFNADIVGYSTSAENVKVFNGVNDLELCNDSQYSNPFVHDQDLIEFLVASRKIIQDQSKVVFTSKYYYIQNLLAVQKWNGLQDGSSNMFRSNDEIGIHIGKKIVPFIHYQNTFVEYANVYMFLQKLFAPTFIKRMILNFDIKNGSLKASFGFRCIRKLLKVTSLVKTREEVVEQLNNSTNTADLVNLLNFVKNVG
jgi:hypothetical protein